MGCAATHLRSAGGYWSDATPRVLEDDGTGGNLNGGPQISQVTYVWDSLGYGTWPELNRGRYRTEDSVDQRSPPLRETWTVTAPWAL